MAHGFSCSPACGIFLDQGSNCCLLHCKADSWTRLPLDHQGSPLYFKYVLNFPKKSIMTLFQREKCVDFCSELYIFIITESDVTKGNVSHISVVRELLTYQASLAVFTVMWFDFQGQTICTRLPITSYFNITPLIIMFNIFKSRNARQSPFRGVSLILLLSLLPKVSGV